MKLCLFDHRLEAWVVEGIRLYPVETLSQVMGFPGGFSEISPGDTDISAHVSKGEPF